MIASSLIGRLRVLNTDFCHGCARCHEPINGTGLSGRSTRVNPTHSTARNGGKAYRMLSEVGKYIFSVPFRGSLDRREVRVMDGEGRLTWILVLMCHATLVCSQLITRCASDQMQPARTARRMRPCRTCRVQARRERAARRHGEDAVQTVGVATHIVSTLTACWRAPCRCYVYAVFGCREVQRSSTAMIVSFSHGSPFLLAN